VRTRLLVGAAALAAAALVLALGGLVRDGGPGPAAAPNPAVEGLKSGFRAGDTAGLVRTLQAELRRYPRNAKDWSYLGLAYQQRARETGDPAWYTKSAGALRRALALKPNDLLAVGGLGSLALSRHRFGEALLLGRRARALSPTTARSYGVIGDALVELGRYPAAFAAFDRMAALKPSLAAYARVSYARELRGDLTGAEQAMRLALDASIGQPEARAWTLWQLGRLRWAVGDLRAARARYEAALRTFPGYVYALDALAQVEWAQGRRRNALELERRAADSIPLPQFVSLLGDMEAAAGDPKAAREEYALIEVIDRLLRANGVRTDLETALFEADHGRPDVARARVAERQRPSIDGDDALAWTLARSGRCAEALPWSERALRLGTKDALKLFHRGFIAGCLGDRRAERVYVGRALALNPYFSIRWAPVARKELSS
jgi:tetratricopeptide (TPR) repeat protein